MTSWTTHADIRLRLEKKWAAGVYLSLLAGGDPFEPLRIPLKHPASRELTHLFGEARTWIDQWVRHVAPENKNGCRIEWRAVNHRTLGRNSIPVAVLFPTLTDIVAYLGKTKEAARFQSLYEGIVQICPELVGPLRERPGDVLRHDSSWDSLLAIIAHMKAHPRPMIYIRQLEIPGVDTKFIESHKPFLLRLLNAALPLDAVDPEAKGPSAFESRFGFLTKPARIRFRILDPSLFVMGFNDLEVPDYDFRRLPEKPRNVFIVENEINGLSFPTLPESIVVFGLGYSLGALANTEWMHRSEIWYWGDIDTHGFAMLNQIRHYFPHTRSFLMDEATLLSHKDLWGSEPSPTLRDLPLLTEDEKTVFDALRQNTYASSLRLEQERISFTYVRNVLESHIFRRK